MSNHNTVASTAKRSLPQNKAARKSISRGLGCPSYAVSNHEAAAIMLDDPDDHGGEQSLAVRWARAFLSRSESPQMPRQGQGTLFGGRQ